MNALNLLKLSLAGAALALGAGTLAHANLLVPVGTYTFTATDGNTAMDGSTLTFQNSGGYSVISSWDLMDSLAPGYSGFPLTPSNSFIESSGVIGPDQWYFTIDSNNIGNQVAAYFEGQNNLLGVGVGGGLGSLFDGYGDPAGNWVGGSVPDASTSLILLAGALAALVACRPLLRGRQLVRS